MFRKKLTQKILAILLIFILTFADFAVVTEAYAATIFDTVFNNTGTGSQEVEFEAYLKNGDETSNEFEVDVNNENLTLVLDVTLKEEGYIKNGIVSIFDANEEGKELNFKIKDEFENDEIEEIDNNTILLKRINNIEEKIIEIPIEYLEEEFISLDKISNQFKVKFEGVYVDSKAEENELNKEVELKLNWKDEKEFNITSEITKFFEYTSEEEKYSTLQTLVKIDTNTDKKVLPIKEVETVIDIPSFENAELKDIVIVPQSTSATNNKENEEVVIKDGDLNWDKDNNQLVIKTENEVQEVIDETKILKEENEVSEKYFSGKGVDEFLITYTFKNLVFSENMEVNQKVKTTLKGFDGVQTEKQLEETSNVEKTTGQNVSAEIINEVENISKGYMYYNFNNEENKYELNFKSKAVIDVSNNQFVEEIDVNTNNAFYVLKDGKALEANDIYYKEVSLTKENFDKIFANEENDDGRIEIVDENGNLIETINSQSEVQEDGYIKVNLENNLNKIYLKIFNIKNDGNLNINFVKTQVNSNYDKETYSKIDTLNEEMIVKAKYEDATELADILKTTVVTKLEDTSTNVNLEMNKDLLSTLITNTDVEFKIELNNDKIESDVFGNSIFEIELPKYIKNIEITNASLIYGEGLEIENIEAIEGENIILKITVSGKQERLSTGILNNGTNIIVTADIELDKYTPTREEEVKLYYNNEETTNYKNELEASLLGMSGVKVTKLLKYSAPTGIVSINKISNYDDEGSFIESIKQGKVNDNLEIYAKQRNAKTQLVIMNNQENDVNNVSILGKIPFIGIKDIVTGDELGTTIDTKLLSEIRNNNNEGFKVYYSSNGNATKQLDAEENGWSEELTEDTKAFLIVPENAEFVFEKGTVLKFEYEYLIPENLEHNTDIMSTFATYYTSESNDEVSVADLVCLSTGAGPQFEIETLINKQDGVSESEEFVITSRFKNTGKDAAYDVNVTIPVPFGTSFVKAKTEEFEYKAEEENIVFNVGTLNIGEEKEISIIVKTAQMDVLDEDTIIKVNSSVTAKDLAKVITSEEKQLNVKTQSLKVEIIEAESTGYFGNVLEEGSELAFVLHAQNTTDTEMTNVKATYKIDDSLEFEKAFVSELIENFDVVDKDIDCYDENSKTINWNIGTLKANEEQYLNINLKIKELEEGIVEKNIEFKANIVADNIQEYTSPEKDITAGKAVLEINQTSDTLNTYIKEGDKVVYSFDIKNVGSVPARSVKLVDKVPTGMTATNIDYKIKDIENNVKLFEKEDAAISVTIDPGQTVKANVTMIADDVGESNEVSATNSGIAGGDNTNEVTSNGITHIIEATPVEEEETSSSSGNASSDKSGNKTPTTIEKTYKLNGIAWLDNNENGMRDASEEKMSGISAMLVEAETGIIKAKTSTNGSGEYEFSNLSKGKYIVVFKYDTNKYALATYQKENIAQNVNSDVIATTIEQDGNKVAGAVTDVITLENTSISNIDIGLVLADSFDLALEKTISKITVQNSKGTDTIDYNNTDLAKTEIAAKYLGSSIVYIEYTIKVINKGDFAGYAKKIVDYMPDGVTFNSSLNGNENWYTGTDGNLYTKALADTLINAGESREIKLILTKQMTEENTGAISNTAEIDEDYNVYGLTDINSTPGNKAINENDTSTADALIGVKTGEVFVYISIIIITLALAIAVGFITHTKLVRRKKIKGGV